MSILHILQTQFSQFDDSAFIAIASKGLLRRAQKDLQTLQPSILETTDSILRLATGDAAVTIPTQGLLQATCTCASVEVCRHRLMAGLWLRAEAGKIGEVESNDRQWQCLLQWDQDRLVKWAGKKIVQQAFELLMEGNSGEVELSGVLSIRFLALNIYCSLLPHTDLEEMVCSCKSKSPCVHRVAAVLSYQKANGVVLKPNESKLLLSEVTGTPRTRQEVLQATQTLLEEMVGIGLSHLSLTVQQRLETLAISAVGVNLPRLSRVLLSLGTEVQLLRQRDGKADSVRLFDRVTQAYALSRAIAKAGELAHPDWIGWHRTQYDFVGHLELIGVGAYPWQTASGYIGLTVLFWEPASQQWHSWSESRPASVGFCPQLAYRQPLLWTNTLTPEQSSCNRIGLLSARRNRDYRLSNSTQTQALLLGPIDPTHLEFGSKAIGLWSQLQRYAQSIQVTGLRIRRPLENLVVIYPSVWGDRHFDQVQQCLVWQLVDKKGLVVALKVPFNGIEEPRIHHLEALVPEQLQGAGIICRIVTTFGELSLYPLSVIYAGSILSLGWEADSISIAQTNNPVNAPLEPDLEAEDDLQYDTSQWQSGHDLSTLSQSLASLKLVLQSIAEQGRHGMNHSTRQELQALMNLLEMAGVETLKRLLAQLLADSSPLVSATVLKIAYLHSQIGGSITSRTR